jgi:hypothetical protein
LNGANICAIKIVRSVCIIDTRVERGCTRLDSGRLGQTIDRHCSGLAGFGECADRVAEEICKNLSGTLIRG